jgi:hypothetical protein
MDVLDGRFRQQACAAPGPTEGVRNTVGKVCFSSGWPAPQIRSGSGHAGRRIGKIKAISTTTAGASRGILPDPLVTVKTRVWIRPLN